MVSNSNNNDDNNNNNNNTSNNSNNNKFVHLEVSQFYIALTNKIATIFLFGRPVCDLLCRKKIYNFQY